MFGERTSDALIDLWLIRSHNLGADMAQDEVFIYICMYLGRTLHIENNVGKKIHQASLLC